ncbi:hypothetical protein C8F04DRAFT_1197385 [Mycena alexandri]|uniref:Uncharacterized protein n=1 Tax=Mycena alexandri TaxID=1745969 RepID=A0AAD6S1X8_9AGAR|nr:hypothetical protein C8F04DRAFT_1197385 [Mycena alexandri]
MASHACVLYLFLAPLLLLASAPSCLLPPLAPALSLAPLLACVLFLFIPTTHTPIPNTAPLARFARLPQPTRPLTRLAPGMSCPPSALCVAGFSNPNLLNHSTSMFTCPAPSEPPLARSPTPLVHRPLHFAALFPSSLPDALCPPLSYPYLGHPLNLTPLEFSPYL